MTNVAAMLSSLTIERPIFHSEADFQHALAWQIHTTMPEAKVRLEYRLRLKETMNLDIWVQTAIGNIALEFTGSKGRTTTQSPTSRCARTSLTSYPTISPSGSSVSTRRSFCAICCAL